MKKYRCRPNLHSGKLFLFLESRGQKDLLITLEGKRILANPNLFGEIVVVQENDLTDAQLKAFAEFEKREEVYALREDQFRAEFELLMRNPGRTFRLLAHWASVNGELASELQYLYGIGGQHIWNDCLTVYDQKRSERLLMDAVRKGFHSGIAAPWDAFDVLKKVA